MATKASGGVSSSPAKTLPVTKKRLDDFLDELAATSNVRAACRAAKLAPNRVYEQRRKSADFARRWQVALCEGYDLLEMDLLHRLRMGELKPAPGAKKGTRSYDNAVALRLLSAHRESAARERATRDDEDAELVILQIDAKLEDMRQRAQAAGQLVYLPREDDDAE